MFQDLILCFFVFTAIFSDKRKRFSMVDTSLDMLDDAEEERPSSCMSVEKDSNDVDEKVDVESPATPLPPFLPPTSSSPFVPPPQIQIKPEVDSNSTSLLSPPLTNSPLVTSSSSTPSSESLKTSVEMTSPRSRDLSLPPPNPFLSSPSYAGNALQTNASLHYHYLYYSHMMSPYLLGRGPAPPPPGTPLDKTAIAAAAAREMHLAYTPYLRSPSGPHHPSPLSVPSPARPAPLHPYYSYQTQLPAHL